MEDKVKEITLQLLNSKDIEVYSSQEIQFHIISINHCNVKEAEEIFQEMKDLGLEFCKEIPHTTLQEGPVYDIEKFVKMRGWNIL
ncbi:MAG: hypothetical protein HOD60_00920 [Candidatus Nitrosopelagicus sp.]|jgi:hypothetical protein|nr:hypothetical protein [Candidatus Nitrosopelagicus sp.]